MRKLIIIAIIAVLTLTACNKKDNAASTVPTIGLETFEQIKTANSGKVIVFNVFATWCPPCKEETPSFVEMYKKYGNDDFELVGLSIDDNKGEIDKFIEEYGITYPVYHITTTIQRKLMADKIPTTVIYKPNGMYHTTVLGMVDGERLYQIVQSAAQ